MVITLASFSKFFYKTIGSHSVLSVSKDTWEVNIYRGRGEATRIYIDFVVIHDQLAKKYFQASYFYINNALITGSKHRRHAHD
jgi:hypothetical protein